MIAAPVFTCASAAVARAASLRASVASVRAAAASVRASRVAASAVFKRVVRVAMSAVRASTSRSNSAVVFGILRDVARVMDRVIGLRGDRGKLVLRRDLVVRRGE